MLGPQRPLKPCRYCKRNTTRNQNGYCDKCQGHAVKERKRHQKKETRKEYGTAAWKKATKAYGAKHPLCENCLEKGKVVPRYCTDHIVELKDGGALLDKNNMRSLCRLCHGEKTAREAKKRRGRPV